jgi:hypothetical protein
MLAGPNRAPSQASAADYALAAGFRLRTSRHTTLDLDLELLEQLSPPPVFQSALSLCLAFHRAFVTPHDMQYPAARQLPALPQGGSELSPPISPGAATAASGSVVGLAAGTAPPWSLAVAAVATRWLPAAADWDDELTPLARALLPERAPGMAVVMATAAITAAVEAQEDALEEGGDPDVRLHWRTFVVRRWGLRWKKGSRSGAFSDGPRFTGGRGISCLEPAVTARRGSARRQTTGRASCDKFMRSLTWGYG